MNGLHKWCGSGAVRRRPTVTVRRGDVDRLFDELFSGLAEWPLERTGGFRPAVDVSERDDAYVIRAELPGLTEADVKLRVDDGSLVLEGEKKAGEEAGGKGRHRHERRFGEFRRVFTLPDTVDEAAVAAKFAHGVLEVTLPKVEEAKATRRDVEIEAG